MGYSKEAFEKFLERCLTMTKNKNPENIISHFVPEKLCLNDDLMSVDLYATVQQRDMNAIGSTHGAFIAGFLDHWMGACSRGFGGVDIHKNGMTTADYQINFLKATKAGDQLRYHIECCHAGKRSVVVRASVYCEDKLVAIATQNLAIISAKTEYIYK